MSLIVTEKKRKFVCQTVTEMKWDSDQLQKGTLVKFACSAEHTLSASANTPRYEDWIYGIVVTVSGAMLYIKMADGARVVITCNEHSAPRSTLEIVGKVVQ